jgi:hypothetical protein
MDRWTDSVIDMSKSHDNKIIVWMQMSLHYCMGRSNGICMRYCRVR